MAEFTREQIDQVALLSRLSFDPEKAEKFAGQLSAILKYVEKLNELDTDSVEPTSHGLEITNVMREDVPRQGLTNQETLAGAPESEAGCFRVPPIIQESS